MTTPAAPAHRPDPATTFAASGGWLLVAAGSVAAGIAVVMRVVVGG